MSFVVMQPGAPKPLWAPEYGLSTPVPHVHWQVSYPKVATTKDSLWIESKIWTERRAVLASIKQGGQLPVVRIRTRGQYALRIREFPLDFDQLNSMTWNETSGKTHSWNLNIRPPLTLHQFRVDLRRLNFPWGEGDYEVQLVFPDLELQAPEGMLRPKDGFKSLVMPINVRNCPPQAEAWLDSSWLSEPEDLPCKSAIVSDRLVTFTNRSKLPISFQIDDSNQKGKDFYRAYLQLSKWTCEGEWGFILGDAAHNENHTMLTVAPGESVKLIAPDWHIDGAGYYRYRLMGYYPKGPPEKPNKGLDVLASEPFVVGLPDKK